MADVAAAKAALKQIKSEVEDADLELDDELSTLKTFIKTVKTEQEAAENQDGPQEATATATPFDPTALENYGSKLEGGHRDTGGKKLRVGDKVQIVNSCRFGDPVGFVKAGTKGQHGEYTRVVCVLPDNGNAEYTPSVYRVTRLEKATVPDED
jgi:hypothetical protein